MVTSDETNEERESRRDKLMNWLTLCNIFSSRVTLRILFYMFDEQAIVYRYV